MGLSGAQVGAEGSADLTRRLVERSLRIRFDELPADVRRVSRDCLADWIACAFAGLHEPVSKIVIDAARDEGAHAQATLLGQSWKGSVQQAALVNGTMSHALDYDDVNLTVPGHMSAAIIPALFALAEFRRTPAADYVSAFVAGYEFACSVGALVEPAHYANGFHATATIGGLGAAMACSHLLGLPVDKACHAIGIAATQSAGLKAMFGSMAKPLHAGLASQAGLRASLLAQKGLISRTDVLECAQGFAEVHGSDFDVEKAITAPPGGFHLLRNLFKFHAACYSTHSTIDAVIALCRENGLSPDSISSIDVIAGHGCSICNIQNPTTGLEAKFSLRAAAAFALLGLDTADIDAWERVKEPEIVRILNGVKVELVPGMGLSDSIVTLHGSDGRRYSLTYDCGEPMADKVAQSERVFAKFRAIASNSLGDTRCSKIMTALHGFGPNGDVADLAQLCQA
jgi:2-methylcitrate dehydratase PrpD